MSTCWKPRGCWTPEPIRINFTPRGGINATDARNTILEIPLLAQCEELKLGVYLHAKNLKEPYGHQYTRLSIR